MAAVHAVPLGQVIDRGATSVVSMESTKARTALLTAFAISALAATGALLWARELTKGDFRFQSFSVDAVDRAVPVRIVPPQWYAAHHRDEPQFMLFWADAELHARMCLVFGVWVVGILLTDRLTARPSLAVRNLLVVGAGSFLWAAAFALNAARLSEAYRRLPPTMPGGCVLCVVNPWEFIGAGLLVAIGAGVVNARQIVGGPPIRRWFLYLLAALLAEACSLALYGALRIAQGP